VVGRVGREYHFHQFTMKIKFQDKLKRFNKFQKTVLGLNEPKVIHEGTDLKVCAKYILKEGSNKEKREIMEYLKLKIKISKEFVKITNS
jgi:hypothetical protein